MQPQQQRDGQQQDAAAQYAVAEAQPAAFFRVAAAVASASFAAGPRKEVAGAYNL